MKITHNVDQLFTSLDWTKEEVKKAAERGIELATEDLLKKSTHLAPLDKGTLRKTAGRNIRHTETGVVGEVYFHVAEQDKNGNPVDYALYTHELGERYKNPTTPGTQPKYLERPLKENEAQYKQMIAEEVRKGLKQ